MLERLTEGFRKQTDFSTKDASMAKAENDMYKAFFEIEEQLKKTNAAPQGVSQAPATSGRRVVSVMGMGSHVKWRFDDMGATVNGLKHPDAETAGLKVGMRLISIAGNSVAGMQKDQILQAWKNLNGATAVLEFEDADAPVEATTPTPSGFASQPATASFGAKQSGPGFGGFGGGFQGGLLQPAAQPAFGVPFGAPAPFGAKQPAAPAFGAQPAFAFGAKPAFGAQPAKPALKAQFRAQPLQGRGLGQQIGGFGGGVPAPVAPDFGAGSPVPVAEVTTAPALVKSADACYHSLDASAVYTSFLVLLMFGKCASIGKETV